MKNATVVLWAGTLIGSVSAAYAQHPMMSDQELMAS
jgi:hypothetical protein